MKIDHTALIWFEHGDTVYSLISRLQALNPDALVSIGEDEPTIVVTDTEPNNDD